MGLSTLLILCLWATSGQVEIAETDRVPYQATLLSLSDEELQMAAAPGATPTSLPTEQLRTVRFLAAQSVAAGDTAQRVTLLDGSTLVCTAVDASQEQTNLTLVGGTTVELATRNILSVQLQALTAAQQTQWQALTQSRTSTDMLVLIRSAEALEKLEGIILGINAQAVRFDFGGQVIEAPASKLAGVRYFAPAAQPSATNKLRAIVHAAGGNRWLASQIQVAAGREVASITLQCGVSLSVPLEQLQALDFSSGSMQYLATLEPLRSGADKRLDVGLAIAGADKLFGPRVSPAARGTGSPHQAGISGPGLEFLGSGSSLYRIPDGFTRLRGTVELRPAGNHFTPCQVTIALENKVLWEERLAEPGSRHSIDLPVQPEQRLQLTVAADSSAAVGDVVFFHDLRFIK